MATLTLKSRRFARDAAQRYPNPNELLDGGLKTLIKWCSENLSTKDIEHLREGLYSAIADRTSSEISGANDSRRFVDIGGALANADYAKRFPNANRLKA